MLQEVYFVANDWCKIGVPHSKCKLLEKFKKKKKIRLPHWLCLQWVQYVATSEAQQIKSETQSCHGSMDEWSLREPLRASYGMSSFPNGRVQQGGHQIADKVNPK